MTVRIRKFCNPPNDTEQAIAWLIEGEKNGAIETLSPYLFLHSDNRANWHIKDFVPKKRTPEEMRADMDEMLAYFEKARNLKP